MHNMFAKSLEIDAMPDKMVVNRSEFMGLLDELTKGMYELMEQYEQTQQARMAAERSFRRAGQEIIDQANASAEDIYAASILYTADTIGKIRAVMDQTNDAMNDLFAQFRRDMRDQRDLLRTHESELQSELSDLADTRKYLGVLRDINREQERRNRDLEAEREIGNQYAQNLFHAAVSSAEMPQTGTASVPGTPGRVKRPAASAEEAEVTVNADAPYFKWKAQQGADDDAMPMEADAAQQAPEPTAPRRVTPVQQEEEPRSPHEDAIYQQVLEDERKRDAEGKEEEEGTQVGVGEVVKNLIFGRDAE